MLVVKIVTSITNLIYDFVILTFNAGHYIWQMPGTIG